MYGSPLAGEDIVRATVRAVEAGRNAQPPPKGGVTKLRLNDVVFIETTQVFQGNFTGTRTPQLETKIPVGDAQKWSGQPERIVNPGPPRIPPIPAVPSVPSNPAAPANPIYRALVIGDNAAGHAISLPVELRDGGVLDFGREHALAWYSIWGLGLITDYAVVQCATN